MMNLKFFIEHALKINPYKVTYFFNSSLPTHSHFYVFEKTNWLNIYLIFKINLKTTKHHL